MSDKPDVDLTLPDDLMLPKPKRRIKTILMIAGPLVLVVGGAVGAVMEVPMLHGLWCKRVGLLCVKEPAVPVAIVAPNHCPDFRLTGSMRARGPDSPVWTMAADVLGKISLKHDDAVAAGKSNVVCFGSEFLATFTDMSNDVTYQCLGLIDGKTYTSSCSTSTAASNDINGAFSN